MDPHRRRERWSLSGLGLARVRDGGHVDTDELLLLRSAIDAASFEPLVQRHSPEVYAYVAGRLRRSGEL